MTIGAMILGSMLATAPCLPLEDAAVAVDAAKVLHRVSPLLQGACIEDVNHEIYGGLYSQMIFGESFQEPPPPIPIVGFTTYGGPWLLDGEGGVQVAPGPGPKLVANSPSFADGEVSVDVRFPLQGSGNAGLILRVDRPEVGADQFTAYEVSLEPSGHLLLGRHRRNWEPIRIVDCPVPLDRWVTLAVVMRGKTLEIRVDGQNRLTFEDNDHPLTAGLVGLRCWDRPARFRNLKIAEALKTSQSLTFEPVPGSVANQGVSGMWRPINKGSAQGAFAVEKREPFVGAQSQRLTFQSGAGEVGIENQGLNRWGLNLVAGKPYEGYVWTRGDAPTSVTIALESGDGSKILEEKALPVQGNGWTRHDFTLTPSASEARGRLAVKLKQPGSITVGHVFLEPGEWGRFKRLPVRKDVAEGLINQGVTLLRYGGSMINHPSYRWKTMIGPRDRRPPVAGTWYAHSTNGWGIFDFLNFCEAAAIPGLPDVNMDETPADMADFIEYVNGSTSTPWGRKRLEDGHPEPYRLKHLELGNEEAVNETYWKKFQPMAEAIWAKDPEIILVVGDFMYRQVIRDPFHFAGGEVVNTLAAHQKILELAKARGREVWFDIHVWTDHPPEPNGMKPERSFLDQLQKIAPGAKSKVAVFEYNSGNHAMKRALSNALATNEVERVGDLLPVACAANCLQPDGQNDNGWDQGLLFLNPAKVWLQPPGYLIRMARNHYQPLLVQAETSGKADTLSVNAKRSDDGKTLVLQVVQWGDEPLTTHVDLTGFTPTKPTATVETMAGPLDAANTASEPERIIPKRSEWTHELKAGQTTYTFPPRSITFLRFD